MKSERVRGAGWRAGASVWYTYTATADTQLVVETSGSDYSTGVYIVYDADPSIFRLMEAIWTAATHGYAATFWRTVAPGGG